jgi:hypothetical protein
MSTRLRLLFFFAASSAGVLAAENPSAHVPDRAPRTLVLAGREEAFRAYVTFGEGAQAFAKFKTDFDREFLGRPFPAEPLTYGNPEPRVRDAEKADAWRGAQDVCGRVSGIAEAAALIWRVTGETRYLDQAKAYLLGESKWRLDATGWESGARPGGTDVFYNDEAHFRLWRKLPLVYDQIRDAFSPDERRSLLKHYSERGRRSVQFILQARTRELKFNSLDVTPSSHPVRFMPMTGLSALALWDDLPEVREWWAFAHEFYAKRFPPWGGADGGWAEGVAYWRGVIEHAAFQDALLAIGDPSAYATPFWKNTLYFQVYNVQPYRHTQFGDLSNAGMFNLEPVVADFARHVARVLQDGHLISYAALLEDARATPLDRGLEGLDRTYPTAAEFLIRNFIASNHSLPPASPLAQLAPQRYFSDVGWVSMHSALGRPKDDIHATFISSPYGSFSHSHAHQNAFVLNAYGENLAVTGAYREWHNSPHHEGWTRLTKSKNAILIDGEGQKPKDKASSGKITRFAVTPRTVWSTGDATKAYALMQPKDRVRRVTRDFVFVDQRYVVIRDVVVLDRPGRLTWALHALQPIQWRSGAEATAIIRGQRATLTTRLLTADAGFAGRVQDRADVPVDERYVRGQAQNYFTTGSWNEQSHLFADVDRERKEHVVYAVLWPERDGLPTQPLAVHLEKTGALTLHRPDGNTDRVILTDAQLVVE